MKVDRVNATVAHTGRNPSQQGAGTLWAYGYADIAEATRLAPLELAELVHCEDLDPLSLIEVAGLAAGGLAWLTAHRPQLAGRRVPAIVEPRSVVPSALPPPHGLLSTWAWSYADLAAATDLSVSATWSAAYRRRLADAQGLRPALEFVLERAPVLKPLARVRSLEATA